MSEIATKVTAIIVDKLGVDEKEVVETANFANDLGADSLDLFQIIMGIEEEFDIEVPPEKAENIKTVEEAVSEAADAVEEVAEAISEAAEEAVEVTEE